MLTEFLTSMIDPAMIPPTRTAAIATIRTLLLKDIETHNGKADELVARTLVVEACLQRLEEE